MRAASHCSASAYRLFLVKCPACMAASAVYHTHKTEPPDRLLGKEEVFPDVDSLSEQRLVNFSDRQRSRRNWPRANGHSTGLSASRALLVETARTLETATLANRFED